jgi:protein involved in polysaccharide export with SLBB domain
VALLALGGCNERIPLHPSAQTRFAPWTDTAPEHRLAAGDSIELRFLFNTELNDTLTIGPDGRVTVPLLGPVLAQGQTIPAFTAMLKSRYARSLRVPELDVVMRGYGSERIYVGGEVKNPGLIQLTSRVDVLQGLLLAGGVLPTARLGEIAVIRRNDQNQPMLRLVNMRDLVGNPAALMREQTQGGADDFPLQADDVVYVARSDIADVDLFVDQYFNQALPFQKSINANLINGIVQ